MADAEKKLEQVENGEACFMLNVMEYIYDATSRSTIFRQNIGEDTVDGSEALTKENDWDIWTESEE